MNYKKILNQRDLIIHILIRYDKCPHLLLVEVSICGIYVSSNAFFFRPATPTWPLLWYDIISDALTLAHRYYWLDYQHLTPQRWILVQYHISKVLDPGGIEASPLIISTFIWWLNKCKPLDLSDKYLVATRHKNSIFWSFSSSGHFFEFFLGCCSWSNTPVEIGLFFYLKIWK